jgi:addiction module HigA family antidote
LIREYPPATPGKLLRERVFKRMGLSQDEFAKALGVSRFTINQILNGRRGVSAEMAVRLAHVLGTSAELWLGLQNQVDLFEARQQLADDLKALPVLGPEQRDISGEIDTLNVAR